MIYSMGTGYALRSLAALPDDASYTHSRCLAQQLGLPAPYLSKVLKALAKGGVLDSIRGPRGGYRLARKAHLISVYEVVSLLNEKEATPVCCTGCITCPLRDLSCPLQSTWTEAAARLAKALSSWTIRDLQGCSQPAEDRAVHGCRGPGNRVFL